MVNPNGKIIKKLDTIKAIINWLPKNCIVIDVYNIDQMNREASVQVYFKGDDGQIADTMMTTQGFRSLAVLFDEPVTQEMERGFTKTLSFVHDGVKVITVL